MADTRPLTFLFTDIEGSTRRWESEPEDMATALARHDTLVRTAIEASGGRVFKTIGDAFCAAFDDAAAALAAAHAAQRALEDHDWSAVAQGFAPLRARMAVHAGLVQARDDDYFGRTLNRVARLLAAGHGGQVLCSGAAYALAAAALPSTLALRELGEHRLKDLDRAERIFQLDPEPPPDGWPTAFPPLRTLDAVPGNLPIQLSSFIGREREMAAVRGMVAGHRMVTVTGIGGTGKTRLALQVAADLADGFIDGIWFVDLAPRTDDESVAAATAAALGVRDDPSRPTEEAVADYLRDRRVLLVLDNCEHLVAASARFAAAIGRACPDVHVLATSREPLAIAGEQVFPLDPLATPGLLDRPPDDDALARFNQLDAVRLFLDRATSVQPAFAVDAANAAHIAEICHRLDGIPLAIELAAARVRSLAPAEIARRLDQRFRLLTGGHRDRLPRQQTLQAAIDWSYELLPEDEKRVLERFSVFAGAVPMALVEGVCAGDGVAEGDVLDAVDALVAKSLVVPRDVQGETWFRILDTIREYAAEKLALGEGDGAARERQLEWYTRLGREANIVRSGAECQEWFRGLEPLGDDLRESVALACSDPLSLHQATRVIVSLWWYFYESMEARTDKCSALTVLLIRVLDHSDEDDPKNVSAMLLWLVATAADYVGDFAAASELYHRGLEAARAQADRRVESWLLQGIGWQMIRTGDLNAAEECWRQALSIKRGLADPIDTSIALGHLGELARIRGDHRAAIAWYDEALGCIPEHERQTWISAWPTHNLGQVRLLLGEVPAARQSFVDAIAMATDNAAIVSSSLAGLAGVAVAEADGRRAARLSGAANTILLRLEFQLDPVDEAARLLHGSAARALLTLAEWDAAFAEGLAMSLDEAVAFALEDAVLTPTPSTDPSPPTVRS